VIIINPFAALLKILIDVVPQIPDGGPFYTETNLEQIIVEPWNALSSLAIVFPAIYWGWKVWGKFRSYAFLWLCIPLLFLNGMGSTFYHAFRASRWLLYMDVMPAAALTLAVSIYFWNKVLPKSWQIIFIVIPIFLGRFFIHNFFEGAWAINTSYFVAGVMIFLPVWLYMNKTKYSELKIIAVSVLFLVVALGFRLIDRQNWVSWSMGTHFLWHIFSGFGGHFFAMYLYKIRKSEVVAVEKDRLTP